MSAVFTSQTPSQIACPGISDYQWSTRGRWNQTLERLLHPRNKRSCICKWAFCCKRNRVALMTDGTANGPATLTIILSSKPLNFIRILGLEGWTQQTLTEMSHKLINQMIIILIQDSLLRVPPRLFHLACDLCLTIGPSPSSASAAFLSWSSVNDFFQINSLQVFFWQEIGSDDIKCPLSSCSIGSDSAQQDVWAG